MGTTSNPSVDLETYPATAEPGAFAPRIRSPKNEKRERILRHSGEKAIYFSAYILKNGPIHFFEGCTIGWTVFF